MQAVGRRDLLNGGAFVKVAMTSFAALCLPRYPKS
jgi:hypothetical protein